MAEQDLKTWLSGGGLLSRVKPSEYGGCDLVEVTITETTQDYQAEGGFESKLPPLSKKDFYTLVSGIEFVMGWEEP